MNYFLTAVNTPFNQSLLTYSSAENYEVGDLVEVPLGKNRYEKACVLERVGDHINLAKEIELTKIREIRGRYLGIKRLDKDFLRYLRWVAEYYHYPIGQHIFDVLPKTMKRPREVNFDAGKNKPLGYSLTDEQNKAVEVLLSSMGRYKKTLLHGVTGSGKTSVYVELIRKVMNEGKNVLFLIPEINLTPQFLKILLEHVSGTILSYHSSITNSEKYQAWHYINNGNGPYIMIGVRSSIFLPYKNLGLIIVDEEHDTSFKQEDRCSYHARDIAIKKAHLLNIPIVLGSATPTIETYFQAIKEEGAYIRMENRPKNLSMPIVDLVDGRERTARQREEIWPFTDIAIEKIRTRVIAGEQVLVFVNRLGFASFVQCRSCGAEFSCPNCSTGLKYFKKTGTLNCSFCEYKIAFPERCPTCGNMKLLQKGFGTEKLEDVLIKEIPGKKVERFDRDNIKNFTQLKEILDNFNNGKIDVLVGTQMLSKGHNFENVNLVVVLGIDSQLNFPDFRSNEKVFQLLTQVAGRPGRSNQQGHVLIETLSPENKIFERVKNYQWREFYEDELGVRNLLGYPPFTRMCVIYFSSRFREKALEAANWSKELFKHLREKELASLEILGPRPLTIEKRANKYSWSVLVKTGNISELHRALSTFRSHASFHQSVSIKIDVDPQQLS